MVTNDRLKTEKNEDSLGGELLGEEEVFRRDGERGGEVDASQELRHDDELERIKKMKWKMKSKKMKLKRMND